MRPPRAARSAALLLAALLAACGGDPGGPTTVGVSGGESAPSAPDSGESSGPATSSAVVFISAPVPSSILGGARGPTDSTVFVAMAPGTVPGAAVALVVGAGGDSLPALVSAGGFDPVAVPGRLGDTIQVLVRDSSGHLSANSHDVRIRPPRVVRTWPQPRRTDVPLNTRIEVVFSLPMASAAANGVRLLGTAGPIAGASQLSADGLRVEFVPAAPLQPGAAYAVQVDAEVRDVLGSRIGETVEVPFRTGESTHSPTPQAVRIGGCTYPYVANTIVYPWFERLMVGDTAVVCSRALLSTDGLFLPTTWTSSDSTVMTVSERATGIAVVRALRHGGAHLRAEIQGVSGTRLVEVFDRQGAAFAATRIHVYRPESGTGVLRDELWEQGVDGSGAVRLFSTTELPADGSPPCLIADECYDPAHEFAVAPDGRIAIARLAGYGGVWVKDPRRGTVERVTSLAERGAAHAPLWSPDGSRLAYWFDSFAEGMTELRVMNADGSGQRTLVRVPFNTDPYADDDTWWGWLWSSRSIGGSRTRWHADGQRLLRAVPQGTEQLPIDGGSPSLYVAGHSPGPWLPDGRTQLVTQGESLWQIRSLGPGSQFSSALRSSRADAGGVVDATSGTDVAWPPIAVSPDGRLVADLVSVYLSDRSAIFPLPAHSYWRIVGFAP